MSGKWFYNGTLMSDGTLISVKARSEAEEKGFRAKGYRPVPKRGGARKKPSAGGRARKRD